MASDHHVVIIGGGFGGLQAAQCLKKAPVRVTLVDRRNFHLFQPLLYQVATGWLSPANIASTLRATLRSQKNVFVMLGEVVDIDIERRLVVLADGTLPYDTLIVATGSRHHYFGKDWEKLAPGLKTVEDATTIRQRILSAFEAAERETNPDKLKALLTFVIVGGGPTGVELAGALGEIANDTIRHDFRNINPAEARILLIEGGERILPSYPPDLSRKAERTLNKLNITVQARSVVVDIQPHAVTIKRGETVECVACYTVIWAAGVQASFLGCRIAAAAGLQVDRAGRIFVEPDLTVPGHPEVFIVGDLANYTHQGGAPLPGIAPVAIQEGCYAAKLVRARLDGKKLPPFHYRHRGSMAIIGRASAVADFGKVHIAGFIAWLAWLFVHIIELIEFENKILVLVQWGWYYFSRNRAARLITGDRPVYADPQTCTDSHDAPERHAASRAQPQSPS
jgi:NADH:quinone reductase (non-electrogenic)